MKQLTSAVLKSVSRSFYLSLKVLPSAVRPAIAHAYLLARAADTIADTRLIDRRLRVTHLLALREELDAAKPGRLEAIVAATRTAQSLDTERMTEDLTRFPGEDEGGLAALEKRADLDRYTYLVAGCVGEFWTEVHVAHRPRLRHWDLETMAALGIRFGKALQLTNVLRDLPRDLRQGRCYLPSHDLSLLGLEPRDLLDPKAGPQLRPLLVELLNVALDHYEAGWRYTFAIPRRETRMRLACAWPLLIGLRTLDLLAQAPNWLDPGVVLKVPRFRVYGMMAQSMATVWSTRALSRKARQLRERIRL